MRGHKGVGYCGLLGSALTAGGKEVNRYTCDIGGGQGPDNQREGQAQVPSRVAANAKEHIDTTNGEGRNRAFQGLANIITVQPQEGVTKPSAKPAAHADPTKNTGGAEKAATTTATSDGAATSAVTSVCTTASSTPPPPHAQRMTSIAI